MARVKKEASLTLEERLQAALVLDWEWPYKLPKNWCWVNWGECGNFIAGSGFKNDTKVLPIMIFHSIRLAVSKLLMELVIYMTILIQ